MLETLFIAVMLLALAIGSVSDFRWHEVPDWLSYGLVFTGIGLRFIASAASSDWLILAYGLAGLAACFFVALLMFYTGQWGGGDSKLLMGVGAVTGLDFKGTPTLILFLINTLILGGIYGICYSAYLGIRHRKEFFKETKKMFSLPHIRRIRIASLFFLL